MNGTLPRNTRINGWRSVPDGSIGPLSDSSMEDYEKSLANAVIPHRVFVHEKLFEKVKNRPLKWAACLCEQARCHTIAVLELTKTHALILVHKHEVCA